MNGKEMFFFVSDQMSNICYSNSRSLCCFACRYMPVTVPFFFLFPALDREGGGAFDAPQIFTITQKRTALSTRNLAGLMIQQFDIVCFFNPSDFFRYGRLCDVTTRNFWSKICQTSRVRERRIVEQKCT